MFAYESTSPEELSMSDESALHVYSVEDDWLLVRLDSDPSSKLGFVPRNYCEPLDASEQVQVADAADTEAELEAQRQAEHEKELAEKQRQLKLKDKVETWSISELEGKKKKKGTLGVGNAAVFFASDTDKVSALQDDTSFIYTKKIFFCRPLLSNNTQSQTSSPSASLPPRTSLSPSPPSPNLFSSIAAALILHAPFLPSSSKAKLPQARPLNCSTTRHNLSLLKTRPNPSPNPNPNRSAHHNPLSPRFLLPPILPAPSPPPPTTLNQRVSALPSPSPRPRKKVKKKQRPFSTTLMPRAMTN